jgi:phosphoenolpyruvate-protein kinase (PTS system EI component)
VENKSKIMKITDVKSNHIEKVKTYKLSSKSINNTLIFDKIKNKLGRIIAVSVAIGSIVTISSCTSPAEKVHNAKNDVERANEMLKIAQEEYAADVKLFKTETEKKIAENEVEIANIKLIIIEHKGKKRADCESKIAVLEEKNNYMKQKMNDYKADKNNDWQIFKTEFNKDMDELSASLKNFVSDNK